MQYIISLLGSVISFLLCIPQSAAAVTEVKKAQIGKTLARFVIHIDEIVWNGNYILKHLNQAIANKNDSSIKEALLDKLREQKYDIKKVASYMKSLCTLDLSDKIDYNIYQTKLDKILNIYCPEIGPNLSILLSEKNHTIDILCDYIYLLLERNIMDSYIIYEVENHEPYLTRNILQLSPDELENDEIIQCKKIDLSCEAERNNYINACFEKLKIIKEYRNMLVEMIKENFEPHQII